MQLPVVIAAENWYDFVPTDPNQYLNIMIFNNGNTNRAEGIRGQALANYTGTNGPSEPLAGRAGQGSRKADPSSAARADKYPIPSLLDYRSKPRAYGVF